MRENELCLRPQGLWHVSEKWPLSFLSQDITHGCPMHHEPQGPAVMGREVGGRFLFPFLYFIHNSVPECSPESKTILYMRFQ